MSSSSRRSLLYLHVPIKENTLLDFFCLESRLPGNEKYAKKSSDEASTNMDFAKINKITILSLFLDALRKEKILLTRVCHYLVTSAFISSNFSVTLYSINLNFSSKHKLLQRCLS
jgi:hypothetical protein